MSDPIASPSAEVTPPLTSARSNLATATIIALLLLIYPVARWLPPGVNFLGVMLLMGAMLLVLGKAIAAQWLGVLVNERNLMSLSRFQLAGWTVAVLAAYFTYALTRMRNGSVAEALNVGVDPHLWALLGISTTSLVGSALILGTKKDKRPEPTVAAKTQSLTGDRAGEVEKNKQGTLYANADGKDAQFTDLFQGDELGNTTRVDVAKVQMFFFSVITMLAFVLMVVRSLRAPSPDLGALPVVSEGMVALLGISHAGYLTNKSVDHTPLQ